MTKPSLLLTRPAPQSRALAEALDAEVLSGVYVVISPLIRIVPTGEVPEIGEGTGVIFTSARAVELAPEGRNRVAYCVGERTARAASAAGWRVRDTAETADALVAMLQDRPGGPLLHLAGRHRRGEVAERLTQAGWQVDVVTLYDQQAVPLTLAARTLLAGNRPVVVPLFSPRSAALFARQVGQAAHVTVIAMSDAVVQTLGDFRPARVVVIARPTGEEMRQGIEKALANPSLP